MSASEKLKALTEDTHATLGFDSSLEGSSTVVIIRALPQIVAVVEAAESDLDHLREKVIGTSFVMPETTFALADALAALDEALS